MRGRPPCTLTLPEADLAALWAIARSRRNRMRQWFARHGASICCTTS